MLNQISVYLIRPEVGSYADALRDSSLTPIVLPADAPLSGVLYLVERRSPEPRWLDFARAVTGQRLPYASSMRMSAVLFVERGAQRLALTFGYGRMMLRPDAVEPDFGLKVAAGLVDPDQLASLDARSLDRTSVQIRRQSSRGDQPESIGFDVSREMLRALAGRLADPAFGSRILGSDSVGLTAPLGVDELGPRLDALHNVYVEGRYRTRFGHIDRWSRVESGPLHDRLNDRLLRVLAQRRAQLLEGGPVGLPGEERLPVLEAPEITEYRGSGFRTSPEPAGPPHPFPDLDGYLTAMRRDPTLLDLTRNHHLEQLSDESADVIRSWSVYGSLQWEGEIEDVVYVLLEGHWWRIDAGYRERVDAVIRVIPEPVLARPEFDPVEWEVDYNKRLADFVPGRAFVDRRTARFVHEAGTVEPCDVFTPERQFVHVKPETSSSALSHLFGQGLVSARLFLQLPEFRRELRRLLSETPDLLPLIPDGRPEPRAYEVVFGIVTNAAAPVGLSLPFFARNYLSRVVPDIESMGYRVKLAGVQKRAGARPADAGTLYRNRAAAAAVEA